jgi:hypothetical protein
MEFERQDQAADDLEIETGDNDDSVDPDNMGYEALLELGEMNGDVAKERWAMDAQQHIDALPVREWDGIGVCGSKYVTLGTASCFARPATRRCFCFALLTLLFPSESRPLLQVPSLSVRF